MVIKKEILEDYPNWMIVDNPELLIEFLELFYKDKEYAYELEDLTNIANQNGYDEVGNKEIQKLMKALQSESFVSQEGKYYYSDFDYEERKFRKLIGKIRNLQRDLDQL